MTENERDLQGLEFQKKVAEEKIEFAKRVEKLLANVDFQAVVMQEYMVQEAARFVQASCDPALNEVQRADCLAMAQAAGHFKRWLQATQMQTEQLVQRMPELDEEIEQLRAEIDAEAASDDQE